MNRKYREFDYYLKFSRLNSMKRPQGSLGKPLRQTQADPCFLDREMLLKKKVRPRHIKRMANDNFKRVAAKKNKAAIPLMIVAAIFLSLIALLIRNSSTAATYVVINADDSVLSAVADVNSDAVASLLNEMNVGE